MEDTNDYPALKLGPFEAFVRLYKFDPDFAHHCGYLRMPLVLREMLDLDKLCVHGGITFDDGEDGKAIIGFDCAHSNDGRKFGDKNWRDYFYVENELKALARQCLVQIIAPYELKEHEALP